MKKIDTLVDIAQRLALSHTTVSRALNDHPLISAQTKARVREAAAQAGYVVNSSARSLRGGPSTLAGLVIPDVRNMFYAETARRVTEMLAQSRLQLVLAATADDPAREYRHLRALAEARAVGVIVVMTATPLPATLDLLANMNVIQLFRRHAGVRGDTLRLDDRHATMLATRHLIELGHRAVAYLGSDTGRSTGADRLQGFRQACRAAGLPVARHHVAVGAADATFGEQGMERIFGGRRPPTGLVVGSVDQVLGCMQWLAARGLRCPDDLSVVGFGDSPWFELMHGGLTTIRLPVADVAAAAAERVLQKSAGKPSGPVDLSFGPTLVVRRSTGAPPGRRS